MQAELKKIRKEKIDPCAIPFARMLYAIFLLGLMISVHSTLSQTTNPIRFNHHHPSHKT